MAADSTTPVVPARVRDYLYPIAFAALVLLGGYGIIGEEQVPLWIALAGAALGTGTATAYRPSRTLTDSGADSGSD